MQTRELAVISVRPDPANPLGIDLKQILAALEDKLGEWVWCVKHLDWLGEDGETLCLAVEAAGPDGLWIESDDLREHARGIYQTIEGEFLAFPKPIERRHVDRSDLDLSAFPMSKAVVAIVAVDGCSFEVYSKDPEATNLLRERLPSAKFESPEPYF